MDKKLTQEDFNKRVKDVLVFAKEKEVFIGAVQKLNQEGYLETIPLYRDVKQWIKDVEVTSETNGTKEVETNEPTGTE